MKRSCTNSEGRQPVHVRYGDGTTPVPHEIFTVSVETAIAPTVSNLRTCFRLVSSETPHAASSGPEGAPPPDPPAAHPEVARPVPAPPKPSLRVLVVDDDEMVLEGLKDFLVYYGHRVGMASGGMRALEMFRIAILKSEPYDVVISDLNMPDVDGYAVARMIKAESPGTPVILISGASNTITNAKSVSACVDIVLCKPIRLQELNDAVLRSVKPA